MKKSIQYLPNKKQRDLHYFVKMILERIPQTQMIILYGSYARNDYVDFDERVEFGVPTTYRSDYDILVVTHGIKDKDAGHKLDNIEDIYYQDPDRQTPVQFINEDIRKLNNDLSEGRYFYTQIKQEGVLLYDSGDFKLARRRKLRYVEILQQAEAYFKEKYENANGFLKTAKFSYTENDYKLSAFLLHQACENLFYAVRLVFTLESNKQHNLLKLLNSVRKYSTGFTRVFPRHTEEEKRLFDLLKAAYVEARYNPDFTVTREDIEVLIERVASFSGFVKDLCNQKIQEYADFTAEIK